MTPEEKLNRYYLKKFGWTLAEVDAMFAAQGNVCAACHRPPGERRMSVDHDHRYDRVKIFLVKDCDNKSQWVAWVSNPEFINSPISLPGGNFYGTTRKIAKQKVKTALRRMSVRQGLCLRCNRGLSLFEDSKAPLPPAERLENLAKYLRRFQNKAHHDPSNRNPLGISNADTGSFPSRPFPQTNSENSASGCGTALRQ